MKNEEWDIGQFKSQIATLEKNGIKIVHLERGEPDIRADESISKSLIDAINKGYMSYTDPKGILQLRSEISNYYLNKTGKKIDINNQIIVTPGSKFAVFSALKSILKKGDEVLFFEPYWMDYFHMVKYLDAIPITIKLEYDKDKFLLNSESFQKAISKKTKAIIINSPHHPTGKIFSKEELNFIVEVASRYGIYIISDEIYEQIYFSNRPLSVLQIAENDDLIIVTNGFSKAFGMPGLRLGYAIGPSDIIEKMNRFQIYTTRCANSISQYAGVTALQNIERIVPPLREEYAKRKRLLDRQLKDINGIKYFPPDGTFYAFISIRDLHTKSTAFVAELLQNGVACLPGILFGPNCDNYIRLAFTTTLEQLENGLDSIRKVANNKYNNSS